MKPEDVVIPEKELAKIVDEGYRLATEVEKINKTGSYYMTQNAFQKMFITLYRMGYVKGWHSGVGEKIIGSIQEEPPPIREPE